MKLELETERKSRGFRGWLDNYESEFKWGARIMTIVIGLTLGTWTVAGFVFAGGYSASDNGAKIQQLDHKLDEKTAALQRTMDDRKSERDKQFDEIKEKMVSKEVFKAYQEMYQVDRERQEKMLQQLIDRANK